jgi:hypothetical protein
MKKENLAKSGIDSFRGNMIDSLLITFESLNDTIRGIIPEVK